MKSIWLLILFITIFCGCHNQSSNAKYENTAAKVNDSIVMQKAIDKQMALGDRPDSEQEGPTGEEVLRETLESYNKIKKTDTLIIDGNDSLKIHLRYYCLHDSTLIVPARYDWWGKPQKEFRTHNFVAKILVIKNRDTVFNNVILKSWFNKITDESLKQYATIVGANFYKYNKATKHLIFGFSVSIPMTDVGIGANLLIDKNGGYEINNQSL